MFLSASAEKKQKTMQRIVPSNIINQISSFLYSTMTLPYLYVKQFKKNYIKYMKK